MPVPEQGAMLQIFAFIVWLHPFLFYGIVTDDTLGNKVLLESKLHYTRIAVAPGVFTRSVLSL